MHTLKQHIGSLFPRRVYRALLAPYHFLWTWRRALECGFPAKKLTVVGITGTKGKSSVAEMLTAILTAQGHTVALSSTIRFAIGNDSKPNLFKMTLPGHGFIQQFLAQAVDKGATHAVIEITSEAAVQFRHHFLYLDALVFTNLDPEHLESHGGMENYFKAKFSIGTALATSSKRPRAIIANSDSDYGRRFLGLDVEDKLPFSLSQATDQTLTHTDSSFIYEGVLFTIPQPGTFSVMNALASIKTAVWLGVPLSVCARSLSELVRIPGRAERIDIGQDFLAVVDYAHTPDSLRALYSAYPERKICVLGNTGGGRDTWKRPLMGSIAEEHCDEVILTNEDPYDENPEGIIAAMASGMKKKPTIILDRREAIAHALSRAHTNDAVLITGKGTDPFIMGARGSKQAWSDVRVVREELEKMQKEKVL